MPWLNERREEPTLWPPLKAGEIEAGTLVLRLTDCKDSRQNP